MDKPKFNLIDGLIIILVLAVIAAGIIFMTGNTPTDSSVAAQNTIAEYSVQFTQSEMSLFDSINAAKENGETVVWVGEKERFEGRIKEVIAVPATKITTNYRTGKAVLGEYPDLYDITITLESDVLETPSSITAAGTAITVGSEVAVKGKGFAGYGFIIDLATY